MPVYIKDGVPCLWFGFGDLAGAFPAERPEDCPAYLAFFAIPPQGTGTPIGDDVDLSAAPDAVLSFENITSLDVVIGALGVLREKMAGWADAEIKSLAGIEVEAS